MVDLISILLWKVWPGGTVPASGLVRVVNGLGWLGPAGCEDGPTSICIPSDIASKWLYIATLW